MEDWKKAGKIAAEALQHGKELAKPGTKLLDIANKIEEKVFELGGKLAFPVNLSLNHIAAHYTPATNDETVYKEDDMLKIDVGAHVNGAVGDTALTVGNNKELIAASEDALKAAIKLCTPGTELGAIGKAIQGAISSHGFSPIINLSGHQIERYNLHAGLTIPNFDNGNTTKLKEDMIIAIEPFATTGNGKVTEGKPSGIYRFVIERPVRLPTARQVMKHIQKEYNKLPFSMRDLQKKFPQCQIAMVTLEREGILHHYPQLPEEAGGLVSQAEHTVLVKDKPEVLTLL